MGLDIISLDLRVAGYGLGFDLLGFGLSVLRIWLVLLMGLARFQVSRIKNSEVYFGGLLIFMLCVLLIRFGVMDFLGFYFFFEGSLIPTLLIIIG